MSEQPERKAIWLKEDDYSKEGAYFITICTRDKSCVLGQITTCDRLLPPVGDAPLGVPVVALSKAGEIVKAYIENINYNADYHVDSYVIMPNHIHLLLTIQAGTPRAASPTKAVIPQIVNALKSLSTKKCGIPLWQRGYYDNIIRDEQDYLSVWQYIGENPLKWTVDEYYSAY